MTHQVTHSAHLHLIAMNATAGPGNLKLRTAVFDQPLGGIQHLG